MGLGFGMGSRVEVGFQGWISGRGSVLGSGFGTASWLGFKTGGRGRCWVSGQRSGSGSGLGFGVGDGFWDEGWGRDSRFGTSGSMQCKTKHHIV